jgi:hypothetical protein
MDVPLPRIELVGVDGPPDARVRLRRGQAVAAAAVADGEDRLAAVATATLEAVGELIPPVASLALDEIHLLVGSRPIVVVAVTVGVAGVPLPHTGSALADEHAELAAARATLSAVNRRLEVLGA